MSLEAEEVWVKEEPHSPESESETARAGLGIELKVEKVENEDSEQACNIKQEKADELEGKTNAWDVLHVEIQVEDQVNSKTDANNEVKKEHWENATAAQEMYENEYLGSESGALVGHMELDETAELSPEEMHQRNEDLEQPGQTQQDRPSKQRKNKTTNVGQQLGNGEKPFTCDQCNYASTRKGNLLTHMKTHSGETNEKPNRYPCSHCSYTCAFKSTLKVHERLHTGEKPYKCAQCNYASAIRSNLKDHEKTHTGDKPYSCTQCSYTCAHKGSLKVHIRTHTGEKPYKCGHCSYASAHKGHLKIHERVHTAERPYKCDLCSFSSASRSRLTSHLRTHTGEKPHKCTQCSYASARRANLRKHQKTHAGKNKTNVPVVVTIVPTTIT